MCVSSVQSSHFVVVAESVFIVNLLVEKYQVLDHVPVSCMHGACLIRLAANLTMHVASSHTGHSDPCRQLLKHSCLARIMPSSCAGFGTEAQGIANSHEWFLPEAEIDFLSKLLANHQVAAYNLNASRVQQMARST